MIKVTIKYFQLSIVLEGREAPIVYRSSRDSGSISIKDGVISFPYILDDEREGVAGYSVSRLIGYTIYPVLEEIA